MIVTIIDSCKNKEVMLKCKSHFESLGCVVNCPCDGDRTDWPFISKQIDWIKKISEADIVVAIPKYNATKSEKNETKMLLEFGESTSYEVAIAYAFEKEVLFWGQIRAKIHPLYKKNI